MNMYNEKEKPKTFAAAALGGGAALLSALILMLLLSGFALMSDDPASLSWLGRAVLLFCGAVAGFVGAKCTDSRPFAAGAAGGAIYLAVVYLSSLISSGETSYVYIPVTLVCSLAGAFAGSIRRDAGGRLPDFDSKKYNFKN